jgi:hypothetical protein
MKMKPKKLPFFIFLLSIVVGLNSCSLPLSITESPSTTAPTNNTTTMTTTQSNVNNSRGNCSYQCFYNELSAHGRWTTHPNYGYVWAPNANKIPDFKPYSSNGHWAYTDLSWVWVSDFSWGWAPFHYGRWFKDPTWGWSWQPGSEWSPAWVAWREGNDQLGWAALQPNQQRDNPSTIPSDWTFVPAQHFYEPTWANYRTDAKNNTYMLNNTMLCRTNADNHYGPERSNIERASNSEITPAFLQSGTTAGRVTKVDGKVILYRPSIAPNNNANKPATVNPYQPTAPATNTTTRSNDNVPTQERASTRTTETAPVRTSTTTTRANDNVPSQERTSTRTTETAPARTSTTTTRTNDNVPSQERASTRPVEPARTTTPTRATEVTTPTRTTTPTRATEVTTPTRTTTPTRATEVTTPTRTTTPTKATEETTPTRTTIPTRATETTPTRTTTETPTTQTRNTSEPTRITTPAPKAAKAQSDAEKEKKVPPTSTPTRGNK